MLLTKIHDAAFESRSDGPIQTTPTRNCDGRAPAERVGACDISGASGGNENACKQIEWLVALRGQSEGQNHEQMIAEIKDRVGKVMRPHPELEYRIEPVPNTGVAELTKVSGGLLPTEVGDALDAELMAYPSNLH